MRLPYELKNQAMLVTIRFLCLAIALSAVQIGFQESALGQGGVTDTFSDTPRETFGSFFDADRNFTMWLSHVDGRGIGDVMSNTAVGGNAFSYLDNGVRLFTGNFQITEFGDPTLSLGLQRRVWLNDDTAAGGGFYYDAMESFYGNTFQQTGANFEIFRDDWTVRSNFNFPVGPITQYAVGQNFVARNNQPVFQGNNIGFGQQAFRIDETAMRGIDVELARSIGNSGSEIYCGYHNFDGEIGPRTDGFHGGLRGNLAPDLAGNIAVSDDPLFGTNVFGGFTWFIGGGGNGVAPRTIEEKMTIPVIREQQVVINEVQTQMFSAFAPLTSQGQLITFNHINSGAVNGNGTFENPFGLLTEADLDPNKNNRDNIYVHSGSTFNNEAYAMSPNQRFIGEGDNNNHFLDTDQLGVITIPQVNGNQFPRPIIAGPAGGLFANNNTQISNFRIQNSNAGIRLNNLAGNVNVNRTLISGGTAGIDILGGSGTFSFTDVTVADPAGAGIHISGGSSNILFGGPPIGGSFGPSVLTQSGGGAGILVEGGHTGTFTQNPSSPIFADSGDGLQFDNANGNYNFNGPVTLAGGNAGIDILGGSAGTFTFSNTDITNPTGDGINVDGGDADITFGPGSSVTQANNATGINIQGGHTGQFDFGGSVDATNGDGLQFDNANGLYEFSGPVTLNGGNAGIDILGGSAGTFTFTDTTITNPTGEGLNVDGGSSTIMFDGLSNIIKSNTGSAVRVQGGHTGNLTFNPGTGITAMDGDGLQFDDADGTYDFRGQVQLNGGDAGIDILGDSAGTFTFTNTDITNPTGTGINVDGGSSTFMYDGLSRLDKNNPGSSIRVAGGHNGIFTFGPDTSLTSTDGDGLQFDDADGTYDFRGQVQLNGGDAGIDILGDSAGTFTFTNTDITNPTGTGINIDGSGSSMVTFDGLSSVTKNNAGSTVRVAGGHNGSLTFNPGSGITATDGDGLQFDNADGTYDFRGQVELNGGDAGIDILGGSAGTFTFIDTTTITNPTGTAVNVQDLEAGGTLNYNGSIRNDNAEIVSIDTTAPGSSINFNSNGANSLLSNNNDNTSFFIFDADGDITITTPSTIVGSTFSSMFATDGDGTWTFNDMTITDQAGLNGGIDVFGNLGTVNFDNLNISTSSAGTGDAVTGFLAGGNNRINVTGNSNINADGGGALVIINLNEANITFQNITSTNNLNSQIGFAGDDGIDLLNIDSGSINVVGTTTIENVDGVGVSVEDVGATVTFNELNIDGTGQDGIISGVAFDNPGIVNVNGGLFNNIGQDGFRIGSGSFGSGVLGGFNLNNTTFTNVGADIGNVSNSLLSGSGNTATPFSCTDLGGNTGKIFFNGGADSCPN